MKIPPKFFKSIGNLISKHEGKQIIAGDFNLIQSQQLDSFDRKTEGNKRAAKILEIIKEELNMVDVWRMQNPDITKYTCTKHNKNSDETTMSRIDFFLVSQQLLGNVIKSDIIPGFKSDHAVPYIIINRELASTGPGFWRLNVSLLSDTDYVDAIRKIINEEKAKTYETIIDKWVFIKAKIRGYTIQVSSRKKKSRTNKYNAIDRKVEYWQDRLIELSNQNNRKEIFHKKKEMLRHIQKLNEEMIEIVNYKAKGAAIRARRNWHLYGEKATSKYFFQLEKKNYKKKNRLQLEDIDGNIQTSNEAILEIQDTFYKQLYKSRKLELDESYLSDLNLKTLTHEQTLALDSKILNEEIKAALFDMPTDKVSGEDGFPVEFYKVFWDDIKGIMYQLMEEVSQQGFPENMSRGIISLLEKNR